MKRPNQRIARKEGEESQLKDPENIFNTIIEENFPYIKSTRSIQSTKEIAPKK